MTKKHADRAHSKIGPSALHRWGNCPGSVRMSEGIEKKSSIYADEGTAAHELAEWCLKNNAHPADYPKPSIKVRDNSFDITDEMIEAVWSYVKPIQELGEEWAVKIEHRFHLDGIHPDLFGTCDAVAYNRNTHELLVIDLKYGSGVAVEAVDNEQLKVYALGAMYGISEPVSKVTLRIVQPRCYHADGPIRSWDIDVLDLVEWSIMLQGLAAATDDPNAPMNPGEWCRWCPAAGMCPALQERSMELAKNSFSIPVKGEVYDARALSEVLDELPMIEAWIESVREFAYDEARHGRTPAGYKLVDKVARRKWRDEDTVRAFCDAQGWDEEEYTSKSLLSPAQLLKGVGKASKDELNQFVIAESSGTVLVHESDKRAAVKTDAATVFAAN